MSEAWVIGRSGDLASVVGRALAELGIPARHTPSNEPLPGITVGSTPVLLVLVDDVAERAAQIDADPALRDLPLLVAADEARLIGNGHFAVGHELLVHPFSTRELQARVTRARHAVGAHSSPDVLVTGTLQLDTATYEVRIDGRPVDFTYMEYELLKFFVTHPDRVFSRDALLTAVWGEDYAGGARTVDVHVRRLRAKLGHDHAERIRTLRSVGYRWEGRAR